MILAGYYVVRVYRKKLGWVLVEVIWLSDDRMEIGSLIY